MSKGNKEEQKWLLGESLNQYDRSLKEELNKVEKRNREQNHKISALINAFDDDYIKKEEENTNISLDYSKEGMVIVDDIKGNTLVNNVKDSNKELVLNGDIDTSGYNNVTLTEGINGGKVDVALEGNTMVNVCDQEDPIAITKNYEVTTGNHIALQGEYDGKCRPNIYGNTLVNLALAKDAYSCKNGIAQNNRINLAYNLKTGTTYTLIRTISEFSGGVIQEAINFYDMSFYTDGTQAQDHNCQYRGNGQYISTYTPTKDVVKMDIIVGMDNMDKANGIYPTITISNYMILEGDYTNKPIPDYFTGMQSSFEDKLVPENLYKFSSRDDFYSLNANVVLDGEYIKMTANSGYQNAMLKPLGTIKPSTTYTVVVDVVENTLNADLIVTNNSPNAQLYSTQISVSIDGGKTGIFKFTVTTSNDLSDCTRALVNYLNSANTTGSIKYKIMVVEGDYTNYNFTNYDATKAGKYKVDYKVTGKNLIAFTELGDILNKAGEDASSTTIMRTSYIFLKANHTYYITNPTVEGSEWFSNIRYDRNKNFIGETYENNETITPKEDMYLRIKKHNPNQLPWQIQLEEGDTATTYEPYKEFTKTLYLNTPLLEGDTIEQSGNDIIHVHRYNKVVLDGSNYSISRGGTYDSTKYRWVLYKNDNILKNTNNANILINDRYPLSTPIGTWGSDNNYIEGITINSQDTTILLYLDKYKDGSDDSKTSLTTELQENPITVVYELATPTKEVISTNDNLLLDSYVNGHLDMNSVVPIDKVVFQSYGTSLKYLSPNTEYTIQFESDSNGKLDALALNSSDVIGNLNIVKGINKFNITTSDKITIDYLWTTGIGFNASKIVVTPKVDGDFGYFKGMKSVGQNDVDGHKIEILSSKNITPSSHVKYTNHGIEFNFGSKTINENVYVHNISNKRVMVHTSINGKYSNGFMIVKNSKKLIELKEGEVIYCASVNYADGWNDSDVEKARNSFIITKKENELNKKEILMNEPLRGLPNGVRDRYVMMDGKWYIERNAVEENFSKYNKFWYADPENEYFKRYYMTSFTKDFIIDTLPRITKEQWNSYNITGVYLNETSGAIGIIIPKGLTISEYIGNSIIVHSPISYKPTYEPIEYNPFEVYSDITYISNNSTIPCNMVIKNSGYNCILKPSTLYTIALDTNKSGTIGMNLGGAKVTTTNNVATITTPTTLTDNTLRLYGKGIKASGVRLLEGDKTNWIPSHFEGMKSCFEDRLQDDGKYKMEILCNNKNLFDINTYENGLANIEFKNNGFRLYTTEPMTYANAIFRAKVKPFTDYRVYADIKITKGSALADAYATSNYWLSNTLDTFNSKNNTELSMRFYCTGNVSMIGDVEYTNIRLVEVGHNTDFVENKHNKIQFLLNEPLRAIDDNIKDRLCIKNNKLMIERNTIQYLLNGNEGYSLWGNKPKDGHMVFILNGITTNDIKPIPSDVNQTTNFLCTQFVKAGVGNYNECIQFYNRFHFDILKSKLETQDIDGFKKWVKNNNIRLLCERKTPVYEEIEFLNNRLTLNSYDNSTLIYDSNIPVSNTSFKPLWEELVYVKNSTTYYIQFNAIGSGDVVVNLGGTELSATITEGYNKIEITTPNKSTNLLTIDGQGIKISKVVVSEALCSGYYKGLQSCFEEHMENGKYVCVVRGISLDGNKVNGIKFHLNEPLRGIGDIKDRLCIKDNKLMVERTFSSVTFGGSNDEVWSSTGFGGHATRNTFEIALKNINGYQRLTPAISNLFSNEVVEGLPINDNTFRVVTETSNNAYFLFTPSTNIIPYRDTAKWKEYLQQNPITVVYQLQTPVYEEITNEYGLPIILEGYENGIIYVDSAVTPTTSIKYTSNNTVPTTLSNVDNLNATTQDDINNNIVTYMMDIDMMLTEMEMEDNASVMSLSDSDDNNQKHNHSHNNILDRMNEEDRIKYQDNTTKMLEKVIKGKSLTNEENINRIDLYLSEGKIREEQSNYLKELLNGGE